MCPESLTFVEEVLILLAFSATASGRVYLVTNASKETSTALLLLALLLLAFLVVPTAGEVLDEVHVCGCG